MPGRPAPLRRRLFEKVAIPKGLAVDVRRRCWPWKGALSKKRNGIRGLIHVGPGKKTALVHRVVCVLFHGPPPTPAHEAGHTCPDGEYALCCNPYHLRWMTRTENERHKRSYGEAAD